MSSPIAAPPTGAHVETQGSPYRLILKLATPTVFAMLTQSVVNEIDAVFFAHLPGQEASNAQAALLPCLILLWVFGGSLSAISVGTQALVARRFAERRPTDAGAVLANAAAFSIVAGVVFTILGEAVMPAVLRALIRVPEVREAAASYLRWRLLGVTSMAVTFAFKAFFDGIGKTHIHLVSAVVMNALNIVLCWVLIFGNLGAPHLGIEGAGIAGFASTYLGLAIMVLYAFLPDFRAYEPFAFARLDRGVIWPVLKLSVPSAIATVAVMTGFALFSFIVSKLDQMAVVAEGATREAVNMAATTDVVVVLKLTFTACLAFGTSTATLVSQSLGEKNEAKAERFGWASVRLGLVIFGVVGLLEGVIATRAIVEFVSHSPAVREAAMVPMRTMGMCTPLIAVGMILTQALFGAGNSKFVMIVELCLHFFCLVPLAWLLGITFGYGLVGIWSAAVVYVVGLSTVMIWKFRSGDWKHLRL